MSVTPTDDTAYIQGLINTSGMLPAGSYHVTTLTMSHTFNFNGSTLNALSTTGAMLNLNTGGVTVSNVNLSGGSGSYNPTGLSGVTINAGNVTLNGVNVSNMSNYGIVGGAYTGETVTNCTITNTGNVGISMINNSGSVSGITITNNTINRSAQGVGVVQSGLMVRANPPGAMSGSVVTGNTIVMPSFPTSQAGEGFEMRNNTNSYVNNNTYTGGSIGFSMVGCTNTRSPNGTYSGQSYEAIEIVNDYSCSAGTGTGAITSGAVGILVDGNTTMNNDTISKTNMSGLTSFPILFNLNIPLVGFQVNNVTGTTTTNAIRIKGTSGITANNDVFTGNNTTVAVSFDTSPGGFTDNNPTYSGFLRWGNTYCCSITGVSSVVTDNILTTTASPTGTFLSITPNTNNTLGSNIRFNPVVITAPNISYSPGSKVYTQGNTITSWTPTNTGSAATYSISPALPVGIAFNTTNGTISGTPTVTTSATSYLVTATNSAGTSTFTVTITVNPRVPIIAYTPSSNVYTQYVAVAAWTPGNTGGPVASFSVSPSLPAGLSFSTATGAISGTPTAISALATYTIIATNAGGADTTAVQITVKVGVPVIGYTPASNTFVSGTAIAAWSPTVTGGTPTSFSISPTLPTGLAFSTSTGVISGTPTVTSPSTMYTVSATNSSGTGQANISIQVNPAAPSISYVSDTLSYTQYVAIVPLTPSNSGGAVSTYSITPLPPAGLTFDIFSGTLYGTPVSAQAAQNYTVTGTNVTGSSSVTLNITIVGSSQNIIRAPNRTFIKVP